MDFLITSFSPLTATGLILLLASLVYLYFQPGKMKKNQEPPMAGGGWPIIGHLHLLGGPRPAHIVLGEMADKYGPLFTIRMGVHTALVVSNWEMAKECLTTNDRVLADRPRTLASELLGYHGAVFGFSPYGPYWRQIRKIAMVELLSPQRLQMLKHVKESEVRTATKELYALWAKTDHDGVASVDMSSWFGEIALNVILKMIVGKSVGYFGDGGNVRDLVLEPAAALNVRWVKRGRKYVEQVLVQWCHMEEDDATWEDVTTVKQSYPDFDLEGKVGFSEGGDDRNPAQAPVRRTTRAHVPNRRLIDY